MRMWIDRTRRRAGRSTAGSRTFEARPAAKNISRERYEKDSSRGAWTGRAPEVDARFDARVLRAAGLPDAPVRPDELATHRKGSTRAREAPFPSTFGAVVQREMPREANIVVFRGGEAPRSRPLSVARGRSIEDRSSPGRCTGVRERPSEVSLDGGRGEEREAGMANGATGPLFETKKPFSRAS